MTLRPAGVWGVEGGLKVPAPRCLKILKILFKNIDSL